MTMKQVDRWLEYTDTLYVVAAFLAGVPFDRSLWTAAEADKVDAEYERQFSMLMLGRGVWANI